MKGILLVITYHALLKDFARFCQDITTFTSVQWFHFAEQENWEANLLGINCTP